MRLKPFNLKREYVIKAIKLRTLIILGIIVAGLSGIIVYSYAIFKTNETHNFVQGSVGEFNDGDIILAVYVDGEKTNEFPTRESGYLFERIECSNSGTARWDLESWSLSVNYIYGPTVCNVYFSDGANFKDTLFVNNTVKSGNPSFAAISTDGDTGMYTMADDYGTSYYFRGTKTLLNNNVIFANHQWKIIRINGDGSIRMIYNGACPSDSCEINSTGSATQIETSQFNNSSSIIYGVVKTMNESWYQSNLSSYDTYIADATHCFETSNRVASQFRDDGTWANEEYYLFYYYQPSIRLATNKTPSLNCPVENRYTKGNGLQTQKVGLILADEVAIAGGVFAINNTTFYLNSGSNYWTSSPRFVDSDYSSPSLIFNISSSGMLNRTAITTSLGVRPVISLNANIQISGGDGSTANPYKIKY